MGSQEIILKIVNAGTSTTVGSETSSPKTPKSSSNKSETILEKIAGGLKTANKGGSSLEKLGTWGIILNQTSELLKKILNVLMESSQILQADYVLAKKAFMMALKPFADFLGNLLKPYIMLMMKGALVSMRMTKETEKKAEEAKDASKDAFDNGENVKGAALALYAGMMDVIATIEKIPIIGQIVQIFAKLFTMLGQVAVWIYDNVIKPIWDFLVSIAKTVWGYIATAAVWVYDNILVPIGQFFAGLYNALVELGTNIGFWINDNIITPIVGFFKGIWTGLVALVKLVDAWIKTNITDPIVDFFKRLWTGLSNIWTSIDTWITTYIVQPIKDFFNKISNWFSNMWDSLFGGGDNTGSESSSDAIKDGIVQNGKVITTDPADYIIATKDPSSLGTSGMAISTMNVNINIQELNNDLQIDQLALKVSEAIQRRTSYMSGGGRI